MEIKDREVVRKIKVKKEHTFFIQALLEDTHLVSVSLGGKEELTIFYDKAIEEFVKFILLQIENFCIVEFDIDWSIIKKGIKMSPIFGKRNLRQAFEKYINANDLKVALSEAIQLGDELYEMHGYDSAIEVYTTLINLLDERRVNAPFITEKLYEKLVPLYFEKQDTKKGIDATLSLVKTKVILKKIGEAIRILNLLEKQFPYDRNVLSKIVELYVSYNHYTDAFRVVERFVESDPKNLGMIKLGGDLLYKLGKFEDALSYFRAAVVLDNNDSFAREKIEEIEKALEESKKGELETPSKIEEAFEEIVPEKVKGEETAVNPEVELPREPSMKTINPEIEKPPEMPGESHEKKPVQKKEVPTTPERRKFIEAESSIVNAPQYIEALEEIKTGNTKKGLELLLNLSKSIEKEDFRSAELIYSKILLLDPENVKVAQKLADLYLENKMVIEAVFYLRVAARNSKGKEKIGYLSELLSIIPQDASTRKELFEALIEKKRFDEAFDILKSITPEKEIEEMALKVLPEIRENESFLSKVAKFLSTKGIKSNVSQQYFYYLGKLLFSTPEKLDAIKWFLAAHRISKLQLEDYVEIGKALIDVPADEEKEIVANAIYSYLDSVEDTDKIVTLVNLILSMKPEKVSYVAKHLEVNMNLEKYNEVPKDINFIVNHNALEHADLVYNSTMKVHNLMDVRDLSHIGEFLELAGKDEYAEKIYSLVLEYDPHNEIAVIKSFVKGVEAESSHQILLFFDKVSPSHSYTSLIKPILEKTKERQQKNPYDYHSYFINGFLYFLTERYEEAIAAFQFVARSKNHEPLMHLFLGIAFDKIKLRDFAAKQFNLALNHPSITKEVKLEVLYRQALLYSATGNTEAYRKCLSDISAFNADFKNVKELLAENSEKRIINSEEEEK